MNFFILINEYNLYLLVPIFMLCYCVLVKVNAKINRDRYQTRYGKKHVKAVKRNNEWMKKIHFIKAADKKLYRQGNPLGVNGYTFYAIKTAMFILCFLSGMRSYHSFLMAAVIGILGYFSPDIFIYSNSILRNNAIRNDMLNAVDCLYLQMSANMTLEDALRGLHQVCENKDLKKEMIKLASEYELSGHNIEKAAEEFKDAFDVLEIELFASALKQQVINGNSQEALGNLSEILREGYIDRLNIRTRIKSLYIITGVIVIMIDIILLTMFPIFMDVGEGMKQIFE